ncbi:MAG: hypothetical protein H6750_07195 [Nitrospiraceae bacterium]|nr:hypothetical protein [Nitrospiraceae bacterium]
MTAAITNITIGVNLIDDYLLTQEAPVSNALTRNLFTVVQNPASHDPTSELLTLDGDGEPVHFYPDPTSQSGWTTVKLGVTPPANTGICNRILGFYHQGVLNALCYYPLTTGAGSSAVWMQSSEPGTWTPATLSATAKNWIGFTFQTDQYVDADGHAYLYGVTGNVSPHAFFVLTYSTNPQTGTPQWMPIAERYPTQFTPEISDPDTAAFRLTEGTGGSGAVTVLWVDGSNISHEDATVTWSQQSNQQTATFTWSEQSSTFNPNKGALTAENLYAIPGPLGSGHVLLLDATSTLWLVSNFYAAEPSITQLTGLASQPKSATAVGVGVDSSQTVTIFAIEPGSNYLWYLQQTGTGSLTFGSWVQLGGTLLTLTCPAYMRAGPELFSAGLATDPQSGASAPAVFHMDQNLPGGSQGNGDSPGTQVWSTRKVSAPPAPSNTTPTQTATYSMELAGVDAGNNPVANGTVTVTADQAVTVVWNSYAYHVGPTTPLTVELDGAGQATVLYEAVGLTPPVITFTAVDTGNNLTGSRWCRGDVVQYIEALDGTPLAPLPDSVTPQLQTVTGTDLINQGLTGGDYSQTASANTAAQAINASGNWMNQNPTDSTGQGTIDLSQITTPHWEIDFAHPEGPRFRVLSAEEARDLLTNRRTTGQLGSSGSIFGDVAHFFKHEFDQLTYFAATVTDDVLNIVFNDLEPFVISTIKQAGAALETIFSKIRQLADEIYKVLQEVIAWLKMLFDWDDILNTHTAFKYAVNQTLFTNLKSVVSDAETDLSKWFSSLKSDITNVFNNIESHFDNSTSFNTFANSAQAGSPTATSNNVLAGTTTLNTQQQHASKCQYVYSRSKPSFGSIGAIELAGASPSLAGSDPTTAIIQAIQTSIMDPTNANGQSLYTVYTESLLSFITDTLSDPSDFLDLIILQFLEAAKDLVLFVVDAVEAVLEAIFNLLEDALEAFQSMITDSIDIPIITWLWKNVITNGDEFTLLDLFCLILAVPGTILYKILYGGSNASPPFNSTTLDELRQSQLAWPSLPSFSESGVEWSAPVGYTPPSKEVLKPLGILAGLSYIVSGWCAMNMDLKASLGEDDASARNYSILSVILTGFQIGSTAPYSVFAKASADWTQADNWTLNAWFTGIFQASCDTCFVAFSTTHTATEFVDGAGPVGDTAIGVCQEAVGVVTCIYQSQAGSGYTGWDASGNVIGPINESLKFMLECSPVIVTVLICLDLVLPIGVCVTTCMSAEDG